MRICFLTLDFWPFRSSGLAVYAERLVLGLAARGHLVTVVASRRPESERVVDAVRLPDSVSIVRVPAGRLDWVGFGWQVATYLRSRDTEFDIVHFADVHFAYAYRGAYVASAFQSFRQRLTSDRGRPYCTSWRNCLFRLAYYSGARWTMERPAVRRASHIIMPSLATQREFVKHYGVEQSRTTLVYLGIDVDRFGLLPEQRQARLKLALPEDDPVLLYVGFSTPRKGLEYLARAMARIDSSACLVVVGKWERGYQERFLHLLGDARSRVRITGYVSDADLPVYFAAADVFVLPTLLEGFGIPLVEAMAAGVPVVTTTGGSAGEIAGEAGLVVPHGDSDALASALNRVLTDSVLAQRMREMGRDRARTLFDERRFVAAVEAVYRRALGTV